MEVITPEIVEAMGFIKSFGIYKNDKLLLFFNSDGSVKVALNNGEWENDVIAVMRYKCELEALMLTI